MTNLQPREARRLGRDDFNQPTLKVAKHLIGKFIVRRHGRHLLCGMITEAEAYKGPRDRAAHSFGGRRTARVEPLYGEGGTVYVYLIYGMHWMLNFSTAGAGLPEGVLIRAILARMDGEDKYLAGPGRVTKYLAIGKSLDRADSTSSKKIWIEDRGVRIPKKAIQRGPRIGIGYAGDYWAARPWRFWIGVVVASHAAARI
ncbi:MAG: DNA-3-methyladenine glycosylase [Betaproteobacteria bacterium]|nr:DNA-3-methyladenine glycosylase [Betaproteobacteria bacterium]